MNRRGFLGVGAALLVSGCLGGSDSAGNASDGSANASTDTLALTSGGTVETTSTSTLTAAPSTTDAPSTAACRKTPVTRGTAIYEGTTGPQYCTDTEQRVEPRTR